MKTNANRIIILKKKNENGRKEERERKEKQGEKDRKMKRKEGRKKYLVSEKCKWRNCLFSISREVLEVTRLHFQTEFSISFQ